MNTIIKEVNCSMTWSATFFHIILQSTLYECAVNWVCVCVLSVKWFMIFVCLEFLLYYNTMMHCQLKFIGHFSWSVEISRKRISWRRRRRRRCIRIMVFKFKRMMENKWDSSDFHCLQIAKKNWIAFHSFLNF